MYLFIVYNCNNDITMNSIARYIGIMILSVLLVACNEEAGFSSSPSLRLEFSSDTITFDTIFAEVGSPTAAITVRNPNGDGVRIKGVSLAGGDSSFFNVLVDGQYGEYMSDLEIRAKDSILVLASVYPQKGKKEQPLMLSDSLVFTLESGVQQFVALLAYSREVTFMRGVELETDTALAPGHYVVYDSLVVGENAKLSIPRSTTLYFHDKAYLRVKGTLDVAGVPGAPVVMRGDRTDNMFSYLPYDRIPGQWGGVIFTATSNNNNLVHCDIHSASFGVKVEKGDTVVQRISIESSKIHNFHGNALELVMSRATVRNSLFANSQGNCVKIVGGNVEFVHCTIANFYVWKQRDVALALYNSYEGEPAPLGYALFDNCVVLGSKDDEVMGYFVDYGDSIPHSLNYRFVNSLLNTVEADDTCFVNVEYDSRDNEIFGDGHFRLVDNSIFMYDFHLSDVSSARGKASDFYLHVMPYDIDGVLRESGSVDAGCYQYVPERD